MNQIKTMPYISVIIPLYNKEKQIQRTIDSVLSQKFADFELIIINDGSTDNSLNVVNKYKDNRVRIVSQNNSGVSVARNRGIEIAKGEWLLLLDADDSLLPNAFDLLKLESDADIIIGSFMQTNEDGDVVARYENGINGTVYNNYRAYWKRQIFMRMGNMFVRNTFLKRQGLLRTDLTLYEDKEWNLRLMDNAKICSFNQRILLYERGGAGLSSGFKPIERDYASIASVKKTDNLYKKKVLGDFIFRRLVNRLLWRDWKGVIVILRNNSWNILFCIVVGLIGYYRDRTQIGHQGNSVLKNKVY